MNNNNIGYSRRSAGPNLHATRSPPLVDVTRLPRRANSTSKLKVFRGEKPEDKLLSEALETLQLATKHKKQGAEKEKLGWTMLAEWADCQQNRAVADVTRRSNEVVQIHGDRAIQLAHDLAHSLQQLNKMKREKRLDEAAELLQQTRERESKLEKKIARKEGQRTQRVRVELAHLRNELDRTRRDREQAQISYDSERGEVEFLRMKWFRDGMKGMADAYGNYSAATTQIFECQREITELVPSIPLGVNIFGLPYEGEQLAKERVNRLRRSLEVNDDVVKQNQTSQLLGNPRRRSEPARRVRPLSHAPSSPPPPYTPTAPDLESSTTSASSSSRPSHLHSIPPQSATALVATPPTRPGPAHLHPLPVAEHPHAVAQLTTSKDYRKENRRSVPQCGSGQMSRLYPELPPNPYQRSARD